MKELVDFTQIRKTPEFIGEIADNIYTNGILNHEFLNPITGKQEYNSIILVNIKGINKFCVTPEFGASNVRHLLIKEYC